MAGNRSFTDCVKSRFHNEIYSAIENYVEENLDSLDLNLSKVWNVGQISLTDMEIKFVSTNDSYCSHRRGGSYLSKGACTCSFVQERSCN